MGEEGRRGSVLTVFSTASAVGKTLIAINMAAELVRENYSVALVDFDMQFGDVANYLALPHEKTMYDAQQAAKQDVESFNVRDFMTPYAYKNWTFDVLPCPDNLDQAYNMDTKAVLHILNDIQYNYDFVVVDTTSAFSELNLAIMDTSTIITFLGIVDFIPTIKNMKIGCDTIRSLGYEGSKVRLVLNRANSKTKIDLADVEALLDEPFYHVLPNAFDAAKESIEKGIPIVFTSDNNLSVELKGLVRKYTNREQTEEVNSVGGWFSKLFNG